MIYVTRYADMALLAFIVFGVVYGAHIIVISESVKEYALAFIVASIFTSSIAAIVMGFPALLNTPSRIPSKFPIMLSRPDEGSVGRVNGLIIWCCCLVLQAIVVAICILEGVEIIQFSIFSTSTLLASGRMTYAYAESSIVLLRKNKISGSG